MVGNLILMKPSLLRLSHKTWRGPLYEADVIRQPTVSSWSAESCLSASRKIVEWWVQIWKRWNFAKLGQIREFFPYLYDSLIWKILTKFWQKVRNHVLKLALQTIVVKYELSLEVSEDQFSIFGPKVSSFIQNGPKTHLFC